MTFTECVQVLWYPSAAAQTSKVQVCPEEADTIKQPSAIGYQLDASSVRSLMMKVSARNWTHGRDPIVLVVAPGILLYIAQVFKQGINQS